MDAGPSSARSLLRSLARFLCKATVVLTRETLVQRRDSVAPTLKHEFTHALGKLSPFDSSFRELTGLGDRVAVSRTRVGFRITGAAGRLGLGSL